MVCLGTYLFLYAFKCNCQHPCAFEIPLPKKRTRKRLSVQSSLPLPCLGLYRLENWGQVAVSVVNPSLQSPCGLKSCLKEPGRHLVTPSGGRMLEDAWPGVEGAGSLSASAHTFWAPRTRNAALRDRGGLDLVLTPPEGMYWRGVSKEEVALGPQGWGHNGAGVCQLLKVDC